MMFNFFFIRPLLIVVTYLLLFWHIQGLLRGKTTFCIRLPPPPQTAVSSILCTVPSFPAAVFTVVVRRYKCFVFPEWGMLESDTSKLEIISMVADRYFMNYPDMDLSCMPVAFFTCGIFLQVLVTVSFLSFLMISRGGSSTPACGCFGVQCTGTMSMSAHCFFLL